MDVYREKFSKLAEDYLSRWACCPDGEIFSTHSSLLWPVRRGTEQFILKVANPEDDEAYGAEMLSFYDGHGAVKVAAHDGHVQLLEYITEPQGQKTLEQMVLAGEGDAATAIICDVIARLHETASQKTPLDNLIPFRRRSDDMRDCIVAGRANGEILKAFKIASDLYDTLIAQTKDTYMPLHGDIHHFNIMHSQKRGWLAIDPKGILGPRVYEYANSLCNPYMHTAIVVDPARMERQAAIIAEHAILDRSLLLHFTFLHAMQASAWSLNEPGQNYWFACGKTAAKLAGIKGF